MESVYKLSVILNLVDNLSSQMNGVQSSTRRAFLFGSERPEGGGGCGKELL